ELILDSEVVAMEDGEPMAFQEVLKRLRRKYEIEEKKEEINLEIQIFDVLYRDDEGELVDLPLRERYEHLADVTGVNVAE
ncbi:MAG: DNA ligase, partial [Halobacteria archaeon]|nr:DNA ligase [Halobacteria archaeon]